MHFKGAATFGSRRTASAFPNDTNAGNPKQDNPRSAQSVMFECLA
jgi:hypothetical protein